ncbi:MAG: 3-phenylpropionate/trans-cinnamate dioxygenase ferredoxin subunit [Acidimicrobiales bacterium]|jgi:3-phenylpropionate/trans-cinnamate dioxygenase ferredoxin subunit
MSESTSHNLGKLNDLVDGESRSFEDIGEYGIVVCNVQGQIYALADNCSHADTPLSEGRLRGWHLTCPLHGASFDIRDGSHSGPPAWEGVPCYQVERVEGEVVVNLAGPSDDDGDDSGGGTGALRTR